jgi:hypothetical protein
MEACSILNIDTGQGSSSGFLSSVRLLAVMIFGSDDAESLHWQPLASVVLCGTRQPDYATIQVGDASLERLGVDQ